ncbi:MAG TPA: ABC transporter substrate-binding protein [Anaerolineales bacterium]|nr:ABC transporter substrate-binding protein [Anaerolineales bacterium]
MSRILFTTLVIAAFVLSACGGGQTQAPATDVPTELPTEVMTEAPTEAPTEAMTEAPTEAATEPAATAEATITPTLGPPAGDVSFFSTQFNIVEEGEKFRSILAEGGNYDFTGSEEGPLIDLVLAGAQTGQGQVDVVGALHGTFPSLTDAMMNMTDVVDDLSADREFNQAYLETGLLGTEDYLYYVPWMQATYIMAARTEALDYLPEGADINALTYDQFAEWCQTLMDETGGPKCGMPHAGLFHRFLEGFLWPSYTGGMVSQFKSPEAAAMLEWARDSLWPTLHPQSISYEFMQEPLQSGEVWVAFDHVARLIEALNADPENFVAFPAPSGPAGRGFMPVVAGLGIPNDAPNPEAAMALIDHLTQPETQKQILSELAFFPVVSGVDTSDLPAGVALEAAAVDATVNASDAIPALIPVGVGARGGDINNIFRAAFDRVVIEGEDAATVLEEEGANLQAVLDDTGAPCWAPDPVSEGPCQVE